MAGLHDVQEKKRKYLKNRRILSKPMKEISKLIKLEMERHTVNFGIPHKMD